jgi:hypothetical protein
MSVIERQLAGQRDIARTERISKRAVMVGAPRIRWYWVVAALALALALAMRIFALQLADGVTHYGDPINYLRLARALSEGQGLLLVNTAGVVAPTGQFPPALPVLLGAVAFAVPLTPLSLTVVNTIIDVAAALLLGRLAGQLGRRDLALPVALAYLCWPSIAFMAPLAYKEGLVVALMLAAIVALLEQSGRPGFRWAAVSGLAGGALVLTQPSLAPLLPLTFLVFLPRFGTASRWLSVSACAAIAAIAMMIPWWVRNAIVFGQFVPFTTSGGLALWVGAQPDGGMVWKLPPPEWSRAGEIAASRIAATEAWRIITADPMGYVLRCLAKFPATFLETNWAIDQLVLVTGQPWPKLANSALLRAGPTFAELIVVITALAGWFRCRRSAVAWLLLACLAQVLLFSIWFEFSERHRLFITPVWLLLAATAVVKQPKRATGA